MRVSRPRSRSTLGTMTPDDEEFLTNVYQQLDKRAGPPTSPQYRTGGAAR